MTTTLLLNGRVHSPSMPDATAMAVRDGVVAWLGSDDVGRAQFPDAAVTMLQVRGTMPEISPVARLPRPRFEIGVTIAMLLVTVLATAVLVWQLQGRIAALRRRFTGSGSTDQAMNAEITRLETAAQDMATRPASAASCAPSKARSATRSAGWTGWTCGRRPRCSRTWRSASGWTPGPSPAIWTTPSASAS